MSSRDRIILFAFGVVALIAASWYLVLAPKRLEVADLDTKVAAAQSKVDAARTTLAQAQKAKSTYATDYALVARLGKAVPADDDVPSLLVQLQSAAGDAKVGFEELAVSNSGSAAAATGAATATTAASLPPGAGIGAAGFPTMPFTFAFRGGFFDLETFLDKVQRFTTVSKDGKLDVRGRLLGIDGFSLKAADEGFPKMDVDLTATAYLLPDDETTTPAVPADASTSPSAAAGGATTSTPSASISETTIR